MRARFAAFVTSRNAGRTIDRSIWDAKEISVNFNKKGAGDKFLGAEGQTMLGNVAAGVSGAGRAGYIFWNAALGLDERWRDHLHQEVGDRHTLDLVPANTKEFFQRPIDPADPPPGVDEADAIFKEIGEGRCSGFGQQGPSQRRSFAPIELDSTCPDCTFLMRGHIWKEVSNP